VGLTVALDDGRTACAESIEAFVGVIDTLGEYELLGASRCHGWTRLDVAVHVLAGWQEMLCGLVSVSNCEPTVDAATYWSAFATEYATEDPVPTLMSQRRRSAAYARPSSATAQMHDVASALMRGVTDCQDRRYLWQGHVFTAGDFLAVWAVENVVHHLDLLTDDPAPPSALTLARATIEALVDEPVPTTWTDRDATLIGTGRTLVPAGSGTIATLLPVFG